MKFAILVIFLAVVFAAPPEDKTTPATKKPEEGTKNPTTTDDDTAQVEARAPDVSVQFMGRSGGMKMMANGGALFLQMKQAKLEEVTADNKNQPQGFKMNVAGQNSWSKLAKTGDDANAVYSTTFTVVEGGVEFALTAKLSVSTTTTKDSTPCNHCDKQSGNDLETAANATKPGSCELVTCVQDKEKTDAPCKDVKQCAEPTAGACPTNYTACEKVVNVKKNELKFSFVLKGLPKFQAATNKLSYGLSFKTQDTTKKAKVNGTRAEGKDKGKKATIATDKGIAVLDMPTTATVSSAGKDDITVDVEVTVSDDGSSIDFLFPAMAEGSALYYDPTGSLELGGPTSASATVSAASAVALSLIAAFIV